MRLIDADALVNEFNEAQFEFDEYYKGLGRAKVITDNAPTVEYTFEEAFQKTVCEQRLYCPKRPQGEWITAYSEKKKKVNKCRVCGFISIQGKTNYCPNCGAEMKGGAE